MTEIPSEVYDVLKEVATNPNHPRLQEMAEEVLRWMQRGQPVLNFHPLTPPEYR